MKAAKFQMTAGRIFKSQYTGWVQRGDEVVLPLLLSRRLPPLFRVTPTSDIDWPIQVTGGLGDKIYSIPVVFAFGDKVGVSPEDEPIFRLVSNKIRPVSPKDVSICIDLSNPDRELVDQIADNACVNVLFKLPVLSTTREEKQSSLHLSSSPYIVTCYESNSPSRTWSEGYKLDAYLRKLGYTVINVKSKSLSLFSLIERSVCVISVNTSVVPIAGGFQVPLVAINAKNRIGYFLEAINAEATIESVLFSFKLMMSRTFLKCWCGESLGSTFVTENNISVIKCDKCGTYRQDVKLSSQGIDLFYKDFYHQGWRQMVEHEQPYSNRYDHDLQVSKARVFDQWSSVTSLSGKWLDVGAASGALLKVLSEMGWDVYALELSADILLRKMLGAKVVSSWESAERYDVISFCDVVEHAFNPKQLLLEAISHLNPEGKIICEIPVAQENPIHYRRLQHLFFFDDHSFQSMIKQLPLEIMENKFIFKGKRVYLMKVLNAERSG